MKLALKNICLTLMVLSIVGCFPGKTEKEKDTAKEESLELLVGTYTKKSSKGIYKLAFNPKDGSLKSEGLVAETVSPSYLNMSSDRQYVYAVGEGETGQVSAFKWNTDRSKLALINTESAIGKGSCYVALNDANNLVSVANYGSGDMAVFKRNADGSIQSSPQFRKHEGSGSSLSNQAGPHAHYSKFYKDKFLYIVDLGIDEIASYMVAANGDIGEKKIALKTDVSDGPRHMTFHPSKDIAYVINEISNSVIVSTINQEDGSLNSIQKISTLPEDFKEKSHCADIHITSSGKFLYASNRGHNSIAMYAVANDGTLVLIGNESVRGDWPRNFTLSPDDNYLLVANQNSDNIVVFRVDQKTGELNFTGNEIAVSMPVCLKF